VLVMLRSVMLELADVCAMHVDGDDVIVCGQGVSRLSISVKQDGRGSVN